ncbi:MAG: alpha/beta fold hydrolase [Bdellovibrionia bacterium]
MNPEKIPFRLTCGRSIYYSFLPGKGTPVVYLNGLSDSMENWWSVVKGQHLKQPQLFVDLLGQGESLEQEFKSGVSFNYRLSLEEQVKALQELLQELKVDRFSVVGFSYGGGVALAMTPVFGPRIEHFILFLPFILRLDLSLPFSRLWMAQYGFLKGLTPKIWQSSFTQAEKLYERFIENYMHYRYLKRIPDARYRQVAVDLSHGIMEFNSFKVMNFIPDHKLILVTSGLDTLVPQSLYHEFWYRLPESKKRGWLKVLNGQHLLLEQSPGLVASTILRSLSNQLSGTESCLATP